MRVRPAEPGNHGGMKMTTFPIACQTITWGDEQAAHFPQVFAEVKAAGFTGVEIGFRHVRQVPPDQLKAYLDDAGLAMAALHIGGNLFDPAQAAEEQRILDLALEYMLALETNKLIYSGMRVQTHEQFAKELDVLNEAAESLREQDSRLLYHNHNWEFVNDAWIIRPLINDSSKALGFCPDIGWVMKGGWDIAEFLDTVKGRIGALHFKDFATPGSVCDTVVLGEGVAPLAEAAEWAKQNLPGMWMIAEQDNADIPAAEAGQKNAAFLRGQFA